MTSRIETALDHLEYLVSAARGLGLSCEGFDEVIADARQEISDAERAPAAEGTLPAVPAPDVAQVDSRQDVCRVPVPPRKRRKQPARRRAEGAMRRAAAPLSVELL